ncbi:hypothetical protein Pfo_018149 [Paulownia fortunei]|nr:hypothetical protein Pfo_018149 [Paulownia fortunei]
MEWIQGVLQIYAIASDSYQVRFEKRQVEESESMIASQSDYCEQRVEPTNNVDEDDSDGDGDMEDGDGDGYVEEGSDENMDVEEDSGERGEDDGEENNEENGEEGTNENSKNDRVEGTNWVKVGGWGS